MRLTASPRQGLALHGQCREVVAQPPRTFHGVEPLLQLRILRGDADGTTPRVAHLAQSRTGAERGVVLLVERCVAVERHQRRHADGDGVGTQRQRLSDIRASADAAGDDQLHLAVHAEFAQRVDGEPDRRQGRYADVFDEYILGRRRAALHAVHDHHIGAGLDRQHDVVAGSRCTDLDVDWFFPVGDFAQLTDLDFQIVRPGPVWVAAGAALVDAGRQRAHIGNPVGNLLAQQHAAAARLRALSNDDFDGIGLAQLVRRHAVAGRQILVDQGLRSLALLFRHASVTGRGAGAHGRGGEAERFLGVGAQRAEAHAGNSNGYFELDGFGGVTRADDHVGVATLAISFERIARHRRAKKYEIVEVRYFPLGARAADGIDALPRGTMDFRDHAGRERGRGLAFVAHIVSPLNSCRRCRC